MTQIRVQRTASGILLGAAIAIGASDLPFVDPDTEWIRIEKTLSDNELTITIKG